MVLRWCSLAYITWYTCAHRVPHKKHVECCRLGKMAKRFQDDVWGVPTVQCCPLPIVFISLLIAGTDTQVASCHCHPVVFHPIVDQLIVFYISGLVL